MDTFGKEALDAHNNFRKAHQAPPLTWSSALARDAEAWAKQIAREGRLRHDDTKYGENLFMVFGREIDGSDAVNSWYSEVKDYNFSKPGFQQNTGHFTQVVWKESRELGIGRAKSADGKMFVVGRYNPAGNNMRAGFKENVFPSKVRWTILNMIALIGFNLDYYSKRKEKQLLTRISDMVFCCYVFFFLFRLSFYLLYFCGFICLLLGIFIISIS